MIRQESPRQDLQASRSHLYGKPFEEIDPVHRAPEDEAAFDGPAHDMVQDSRSVQACGTRHEITLAQGLGVFQVKSLLYLLRPVLFRPLSGRDEPGGTVAGPLRPACGR
jgi:hypothetical protein